MSQPVGIKLAIQNKPVFTGRPGVVQVLQATSGAPGQAIIEQRSPAFKQFATVRPFMPSAAGTQLNTNTAIQYVRKPAEVTVLSTGNTFVAAPMGQSFASYGSPIMALNPNMIQSLSGPPGLNPSSVGAGGMLSSLANSRKPCNCTKSHCLKLYCECFAQGQLCQNCNCTNCMNNLAYEEERGRAIKMTLERNPTAFHPKIGRGEGERKHTKGCNCKRSGCLKNYCECYEAKISCSDLCRCQGCRNTEDSVERRSLMRLAAMGSLRSRQPASFKKHLIKPPPETLPHVFFTWEVIEATVSCLLAQAEEAERRDLPPAAQERIVLEEFGHILEHVIDSASKAQVRPPSIHAPDSDTEQSIIHSMPRAPTPVAPPPQTETVGVTQRIPASGGVGAATAAAAAADVLLRDDEDDDEEEMMREIGVDDEADLEDEIFDEDDMGGSNTSHNLHSQRHSRQALGRRPAGGQRQTHTHVPDLMDEEMMSDEDTEGLSTETPPPARRHPSSHSSVAHKYRQGVPSRSRSSQPFEPRYHSHTRRSTSGGRGHEHHDPDSMI
ncbi:unnamed protein product [Calicophoron daubneyi]|uniref:CRC domain-containing protein n=1 Tax=Calicophoron daubneyi TaxID=300641 RepID=A0AAV2T8B9_CALDB